MTEATTYVRQHAPIGALDGGIEVRPVGGALGAEVHGADLRSLDEAGADQLKALLHEYEVLFFPGAHLSGDEQMALGRCFGEVALFPLARLMGHTEPTFQVISDGPESPPEADYWHTDVTWTAEPPNYALLHAELMPARGGDTLWASMTTAYERLSPTMRHVLDELQVVHDNESFIRGMYRKMPGRPEVDELAERLRAAYPPVLHPLVRTHPDTGRQALFLGGRFMRRIEGMTDDESQTLLGFLLRHIEDPALQCRWRWQPGDLAIWDERSTNHRSAGDHFPQRRQIRRIEITGERPFHRRVDPRTLDTAVN